MEIIIKGSRYVRGGCSQDWTGMRRDELHKRRKELSEKIKDGIMSVSEMNRGEEGEPEFDRKVERYDRWKKEKEPLMKEWHKINKEFKKHNTEGRTHSIDDLRKEGKLKFD